MDSWIEDTLFLSIGHFFFQWAHFALATILLVNVYMSAKCGSIRSNTFNTHMGSRLDMILRCSKAFNTTVRLFWCDTKPRLPGSRSVCCGRFPALHIRSICLSINLSNSIVVKLIGSIIILCSVDSLHPLLIHSEDFWALWETECVASPCGARQPSQSCKPEPLNFLLWIRRRTSVENCVIGQRCITFEWYMFHFVECHATEHQKLDTAQSNAQKYLGIERFEYIY